jgi:hypothetical protein
MKRLIPLMAIAVILVAAVGSDIKAGGYRYSSGCGYSTPTYYSNYYSAPQIVYRDVITPVAYPVPFTVAVPVVSYLYNGGGTYAPVFQAQPAGIATVATAPAVAANQTVSLSEAQLDTIIDRIEKRLQARGQQPATNGNVGSPPPPPVPSSTSSVHEILNKNCASCHTGSTAKKGVKIFDDKAVLSQTANRAAIWDAADAGRMPPDAQKDVRHALPDSEVAVLRAWMLGK